MEGGVPSQPSRIRFCSTDIWVKERLVSFDPVGHTLSYDITENNMGLTRYIATLKVVSALSDGDGCELEWSFVADPVNGVSEEGLASYLQNGVDDMAAKVEDALRKKRGQLSRKRKRESSPTFAADQQAQDAPRETSQPSSKRRKTSSSLDVMMPRGLINPGSLSFVNAALQALLSCTPFVHLVRELGKRSLQKDEHPILHGFASFISKFDIPSYRRNEIRKPFCASMFKDVIQKFIAKVPICPSDGMKSRVDGMDFLDYILNGMHIELLKLRGSSSVPFVPSELSDLFWGQQRSIINKNGPAMQTVQPFNMLHLDIRPSFVQTIEDSLRLVSRLGNLEGYKSSKIQMGYEDNMKARIALKIEKLPNLLVLHLSRFNFRNSGFFKLEKRVDFPLNLKIENDFLSTPSQHQYQLVGSITHHGTNNSIQHYSADVRYPDGRWMRLDDRKVTKVSLKNVLHGQAYILFYERLC